MMDPSEFGKLFRLFLGLPTNRPTRGSNYPYNEQDDGEPDEPRGQGMSGEDGGRRNFTVLTDPLEIHKFFEQQMDDMLRNFGQGFGGLGRGAIMMEPSEEEDGPVGSPRDFMLKDEGQPRVDTDLDSNQVDMGELETLMGRKETRSREEGCGRGGLMGEGGLFPGGLFGGIQGGGVSIFGGLGGQGGEARGEDTFLGSFGTSVVERSISLPGGGVETSRTVRNSDGTEVVTVTRQMGDQAHQQTTTRDKDGSTTIENRLTNMEESGLTQFNNTFRGEEDDGGGWEVQPSPRQEMMGPPGDQLYSSLWSKFWGN